MAIGMSVPGYTAGNWSPAGQALFGGNSPGQMPAESEEERRKRLQALQIAQASIGARLGAGYGSALGARLLLARWHGARAG
jgi:hypothetical protein